MRRIYFHLPAREVEVPEEWRESVKRDRVIRERGGPMNGGDETRTNYF